MLKADAACAYLCNAFPFMIFIAKINQYLFTYASTSVPDLHMKACVLTLCFVVSLAGKWDSPDGQAIAPLVKAFYEKHNTAKIDEVPGQFGFASNKGW